MPSLHTFRFLLFFFLLNNAWNTLSKSISELGAFEVLIKVQVFDNSDLSPLADAAVEIFGNQSTLATSKSSSNGVVMATFLYRPGTWVIVTAAKQDYVTNSAPWHANRVPLYASVSLYLLPQRQATLILYDDVVQMLLGSPGSRSQPWVQFQRKAVRVPLNNSYADLAAVLTAAKSQYEIGGFPYPLGSEGNGTGGDGGWVDLMAVAAVSAHLSSRNGSVLHVSDPVHISIPLPSDTLVRTATSVPVWRFEASTGLWLRNGTGYIKKEGVQLTWSFVAPQLGYWLAAFPSASGLALNPPGLRDITTYHTIFLLTILGSLALLVLVLLCLLLYYCRRRCLKPRHQHRKMHSLSAPDSSRQDQGTSTSHLNLISGGHMETTSSNGNLEMGKADGSSQDEYFRHVPAQKVRHTTADTAGRRGESFPMKVTCSTETNNLDAPGDRHRRHNANDNQGYSSDPPSPPPFRNVYQDSGHSGRPPEYSASQASESIVRPSSLNTQPGQLVFCSSMEQMQESMYRSMVPTLVIPAHYMRLSTDFSGVEQALEQQQQQQHDREGIQVSVTLPRQANPHQQQQAQQQAGQQGEPSGPVRIPVLFDDSTMAQMNGELQALTEKKLLELGVKPHPRAWFVSLDGRSNSLVRHSYIELGSERRRESDGAQEARADARDARAQPRRAKEERGGGGGERKGHGGKAYAKLAGTDGTGPSSSESHAAVCSPEDNTLTPLLDEAPEPRGATFPRPGRNRAGGGTKGGVCTDARRGSVTSPEENNDADDKDDEGENKKSPWQRREERPLMVFNVK